MLPVNLSVLRPCKMSLAWWGASVELLPSLSGKTEMSQHLDRFLWRTLKLFIYLCSCWLLLVSKSFGVAAAGCLATLSVNFSTNSCPHKRPNCIEQSIQPQPELPGSCSAILVRHSKQMPLAWGIVNWAQLLYGVTAIITDGENWMCGAWIGILEKIWLCSLLAFYHGWAIGAEIVSGSHDQLARLTKWHSVSPCRIESFLKL